MKLTLTRVLTPLAALAIAFGAQAALPANEGFEGEGLAGQIIPKENGWIFAEGLDGAADQSAITAYAKDETLPANRPDAFAGTDNANYLKLATEDGILFRQVDGGEVKTIPDTGLYLDTVVQFTVTDKTDRPEPTNEDKFILWLEAAENNETKQTTTNLCVYAGYLNLSDDGNSFAAAIEKKVYKLTVPDVEILPGSWHRLTVKAAKDIFPKTANFDAAGFQIYIDGKLANGEEYVCDSNLVGDGRFSSEDAAVLEGMKAFPSMVNAAELKLVGFSGEGKIDDVVITEQLPGVVPHKKLTLTWDSKMVTSVTVLGKTYAQSPAVINVEAGQVITLTKADFAFTGAANKYQFVTWEATEGIVVADTAADSRTITVGAAGSVNLAFEDAMKINVTLNLGAIETLDVWGNVTRLGYQIGNAEPIVLTEDQYDAAIVVPGVEPGQTVTLVLELKGYTASLTTADAGVTANGLVLTVADTVAQDIAATLVLEEPAAKVFKVGGTEYTLAEVIAALADGTLATTAEQPLKLTAAVDLDAPLVIANNATVFIDLAGQTLTGAADADVFTIAGALTIMNSGTGGGIQAAADQAIASNIAGTLTIEGAADYVGAITKAENAGTINITAGSFSTNVDATFPTGYGLTYDEGAQRHVYGALTYTISFNANGGEGSMAAQTYTVNTETFTLTPNGFTAPTGKKFAGWAETADGQVVYADGASFPVSKAANVTLYAIWTDAAQPVAPGEQDATEYADEKSAAAAAAAIVIAPSSEVDAVLTDKDAKDAYTGLFEVKPVQKDNGKWVNEVVLKATAVDALQKQVDADVTEKLDPAAIAAADGSVSVTITTTPGFYYAIKSGASLNAMTVGEKTLAGGETLTISVANKGVAGFYQVVVDIKK